MKTAARRLALALGVLAHMPAACTSTSGLQLERVAYLAAGDEARTATDRVLDVLAPYERITELTELPPEVDGVKRVCPGDLIPDQRRPNFAQFRGY